MNRIAWPAVVAVLAVAVGIVLSVMGLRGVELAGLTAVAFAILALREN